MRRILLAFLAMASPAFAATTLTATHIAQDSTGAVLASGSLCVTPVVNGKPVGYQATGNTQVLPRQACTAITNGAIAGMTVQDTSTSLPAGMGYQVRILNPAGITLYILPQPIYPTGSTWSLDTWVPTAVTPAAVTAVSYASQVPTGSCGAAAQIRYVTITGTTTTYECVGGTWQAFAVTLLASSETVTFSATPTFSIATRSSVLTLTGNVTSFTLAAGADGQEKTLIFVQDATGGRTVVPPSNVLGFFTVGSTASKRSAQHFTYSTGLSAWVADSAGVTNL